MACGHHPPVPCRYLRPKMSIADKWLLPDGVEDVLPPHARGLEQVRRRLLDLFHAWGYEYVIPPMVEFLESLLTGTGRDLDVKTLKVVDLLSGRMMGVRADITPQVARIDAHSLNQEGVVRLCYAGTIVQATQESMLDSRTPLSVGAELFGDSASHADIEIVSLMVEAMHSLKLPDLHIDLGDVSIFREFTAKLPLDDDQREQLFELVQAKAGGELASLGKQLGLNKQQLSQLCALPDLCGDANVLNEARQLFAGKSPSSSVMLESIDNLDFLARSLTSRFDNLKIYFDLSELRGYGYHTGIVFAAYSGSEGQVIAQGGRYDHVGQVFGRKGREATGFSINVRNLAACAGIEDESPARVCLGQVEPSMAADLWRQVQQLRAEGYVVLEGTGLADVQYHLVGEKGEFRLEPVSESIQARAATS